ncbi:flavin reductase family protein [Candidatus Uabimicrobium sp. HlEnr_7]|uniref:flavin reductase family protein n=1 Tax=Candidatus Uabimicrobium helgolandensis TaxID=3095367 RepID=UPI003559137F
MFEQSFNLKKETQRIYTLLADKFLQDKKFATKSDKEISKFIHGCVRIDSLVKKQISNHPCKITVKLPRQKLTMTNQEFNAAVDKAHRYLFLKKDNCDQNFSKKRRACYIQRKVCEAQDTYSFYLVPCDGKPLLFLSLSKLMLLYLDKSHYSSYHIASPPNPYYYHIVVERKRPVSDFLNTCATVGDIVEVSFIPSSIDLLPTNSYIFIAIDDQIASVLAMVSTLMLANSIPNICIFYGTRDSDRHIFRDQLQQFSTHNNIQVIVCYSEPFEDDIEGKDYNYEGKITIDLLSQTLPSFTGKFYIFASPQMAGQLAIDLEENGVSQTDIHRELYASIIKKTRPKKKKIATQLQRDKKSGFLKEIVSDLKVRKKIWKEQKKKVNEWLSEDAGRPGPLEWLVIYFVPLLRLAQQTIGLYFIIVIHFFDTIVKVVTSYVYNIYYSWKMLWAVKRKRDKEKSKTNILTSDVIFARMALSKNFRFRGFDLEEYHYLLTPLQWQKLTKPSFAIKEVLEIRRHLEEMYLDLDLLTDEQVLRTTKNSILSFVLSYIPNPFEFVTTCKDWFLIAFVIRYRREEVEKMYIDFVHAYQQLVPIVEKNTSNALVNNDYEEILAKNSSLQILPQTVESQILYSKEKLRNIQRVLCNPEHVLTIRKWPRSDLLREVISWSENGCHLDCIAELENYLLREVKTALLRQGAKIDTAQQITQIIRRRKTKPYEEEVNENFFYVYFAKSRKHLNFYIENQNILEFAEENGIELESGCRAGNCHTCLVRLIKGKISYTHDVDTDDIPEGYFLSCSAIPDKKYIVIDA